MMEAGVSFGSVCSGIEAASVAWHPLGWRAAWLAEIEPFPSAVLQHHYPQVPNVGDMATLPARIRAGAVLAPDLFCGGTPCQAFSVAGLRRSLDDARGNLSLTFCEIADAIDSVRLAAGKPASIVFWENVPGVLSTADNAFGCFLGALAGCDTAIEPLAATGWTDAGVVAGPSRAVAWRVLDAQFFGLAQRRRRVFVVASSRDGFDPGAVLLEWEGLRRDTPPSREAGQSVAVCPTLRAGGNSTGGDRPPGTDVDTADSLQVVAFGGGQNCAQTDVSTSLSAHPGGSRLDFQTETFVASVGYPDPAYAITAGAQGKGGVFGSGRDSQDTFVTHSLRGEGFDASEDGTGRGTPLVPVAWTGDGLTADPISASEGRTYTHEGANFRLHNCVQQPVAFDTTQITSAANYSNPKPGDPCHPLAAGAHAPAIAFSAKDSGADATTDLSPTLRVMGNADSHANGGGQMAVAFQSATEFLPQSSRVYSETEAAPTLQATGARNGNRAPQIQTAMQVRRLTPVECERLQGFPDGYTAIAWRGKPADQCPDGPRYKALGNSWAVPVVRWIGRRIDAAVRQA
jgi:DNA (cytosine-5)-methyltransferase 1